MNGLPNINKDELNALLAQVAKKTGIEEDRLRQKVESGDLDNLIAKAAAKNPEMVEKLLKNPSAADDLLSSPQARFIISRLLKK